MSQSRKKRKESGQASVAVEVAMGLNLPEVLEAIEGAALARERERELRETEAEEQAALIASTQESGAAPVVHEFDLKRTVESLLFASDRPLTAPVMRQLLGQDVTRADVQEALDELSQDFRTRGIVLHDVAGGYQFRTHAASSQWVQKLIAGRPVRLSRAQLDSLAIIAYRQPITRPEIDDIRGVDSGSTLKLLLDRNLVRILGKKEEVGRPLLYGTTKDFLEFFNLSELRELPTLREFHELNDEGLAEVDKLGADIEGVDVGAVAAEVAAERAAAAKAAEEAAAIASAEKAAAKAAAAAEKVAAATAAAAAASGQEELGLAKEPPREASVAESDVEIADFASGTELPAEARLADQEVDVDDESESGSESLSSAMADFDSSTEREPERDHDNEGREQVDSEAGPDSPAEFTAGLDAESELTTDGAEQPQANEVIEALAEEDSPSGPESEAAGAFELDERAAWPESEEGLLPEIEAELAQGPEGYSVVDELVSDEPVLESVAEDAIESDELSEASDDSALDAAADLPEVSGSDLDDVANESVESDSEAQREGSAEDFDDPLPIEDVDDPEGEVAAETLSATTLDDDQDDDDESATPVEFGGDLSFRGESAAEVDSSSDFAPEQDEPGPSREPEGLDKQEAGSNDEGNQEVAERDSDGGDTEMAVAGKETNDEDLSVGDETQVDLNAAEADPEIELTIPNQEFETCEVSYSDETRVDQVAIDQGSVDLASGEVTEISVARLADAEVTMEDDDDEFNPNATVDMGVQGDYYAGSDTIMAEPTIDTSELPASDRPDTDLSEE